MAYVVKLYLGAHYRRERRRKRAKVYQDQTLLSGAFYPDTTAAQGCLHDKYLALLPIYVPSNRGGGVPGKTT